MGRYCYDYPRPAVTVDVVVLQWRAGRLEVLLIQRAREPFAGQWALPGGFVDMDEPLDTAARRELQEETGVSDLPIRELGMFGAPGRDPRGRVISAAYYALVPAGRALKVEQGDDASRAAWFALHDLPALAFDHNQVLQATMSRLRQGVLYFGEAFDLLGEAFSIPQLQGLYEAVLGRSVDGERLRRRMEDLGLIRQSGERREGGTAYRLDRGRLEEIIARDVLAPFADDA